MVINNNTDFGDKLSLIKPSYNMSNKFKLKQISITKHKRDILTRKTKDNIRG